MDTEDNQGSENIVTLAPKVTQPRYKGRKFEELIRIASELFCSYGFSGTSMRDIGFSLKLDKSSIYNYISSKEQILEIINQIYIDKFIEPIFNIASDDSINQKPNAIIDFIFNASAKEYKTIIIVNKDNMFLTDTNNFVKNQNRLISLLINMMPSEDAFLRVQMLLNLSLSLSLWIKNKNPTFDDIEIMIRICKDLFISKEIK